MSDVYDHDQDDDEPWDEDDGHEYVEVGRHRAGSPRRRRGRRILLVLLGLLIVAGLLAGALGYYVARKIDPPGGPGEAVTLEVPEGSSTNDIGELLAEAGVITDARIWRYYIKVKGAGPFQAGRYEFRKSSSMGAAMNVLDDGAALPDFGRVTVPEGYTVTEIIERLADPAKGIDRLDAERLAELLRVGQVPSLYRPADQPSYEGLLFPDTYRIEQGQDELAVLTQMTQRLESVMAAAGVDTAEARLGLDPYQVIIVASLIEEEAKVPEDKAKIARVIYNRLEQGIPLGIDATSRYEAVLEGRSRDDIDFTSSSHYNTRRVAGLPPTPIASPGKSSIEAALNPEDGPWIFYVLEDAQGHHFFTESAKEFERAKARCKANGLGCG